MSQNSTRFKSMSRPEPEDPAEYGIESDDDTSDPMPQHEIEDVAKELKQDAERDMS